MEEYIVVENPGKSNKANSINYYVATFPHHKLFSFRTNGKMVKITNSRKENHDLFIACFHFHTKNRNCKVARYKSFDSDKEEEIKINQNPFWECYDIRQDYVKLDYQFFTLTYNAGMVKDQGVIPKDSKPFIHTFCWNFLPDKSEEFNSSIKKMIEENAVSDWKYTTWAES